MAFYGAPVIFTGWTPTLSLPLFGGPTSVINQAGADFGVISKNGLTQDDNRIANMLQKKANQAIRMLMITLTGATVGATANKAFKRSQAQNAFDPITGLPNPNPTNPLNGGLIPIESVSYINRVTTTGDQANILALLNRTHAPAAYAIDTSGNGGGGKASTVGGAYR